MFLNSFHVNVVIKVRFILLFFSNICVNAKVVRLIITISSKSVIPRNGNSGNVATCDMLFRSLLQNVVAIRVSFFNGINGVLICGNTIMRCAIAFFGLESIMWFTSAVRNFLLGLMFLRGLVHNMVRGNLFSSVAPFLVAKYVVGRFFGIQLTSGNAPAGLWDPSSSKDRISMCNNTASTWGNYNFNEKRVRLTSCSASFLRELLVLPFLMFLWPLLPLLLFMHFFVTQFTTVTYCRHIYCG